MFHCIHILSIYIFFFLSPETLDAAVYQKQASMDEGKSTVSTGNGSPEIKLKYEALSFADEVIDLMEWEYESEGCSESLLAEHTDLDSDFHADFSSFENSRDSSSSLMSAQQNKTQNHLVSQENFSHTVDVTLPTGVNHWKNDTVRTQKKRSTNPFHDAPAAGMKFPRISEIPQSKCRNNDPFVPPSDKFAKSKRSRDNDITKIQEAIERSADDFHKIAENMNNVMKLKAEYLRNQLESTAKKDVGEEPSASRDALFNLFKFQWMELNLKDQGELFSEALDTIE